MRDNTITVAVPNGIEITAEDRLGRTVTLAAGCKMHMHKMHAQRLAEELDRKANPWGEPGETPTEPTLQTFWRELNPDGAEWIYRDIERRLWMIRPHDGRGVSGLHFHLVESVPGRFTDVAVGFVDRDVRDLATELDKRPSPPTQEEWNERWQKAIDALEAQASTLDWYPVGRALCTHVTRGGRTVHIQIEGIPDGAPVLTIQGMHRFDGPQAKRIADIAERQGVDTLRDALADGAARACPPDSARTENITDDVDDERGLGILDEPLSHGPRSILDDPWMSGKPWVSVGAISEEMCAAWPVWQYRESAAMDPSEWTILTDWVMRAPTHGSVRPLRLPGMNTKGVIRAEDMTVEHFELVAEWQFWSYNLDQGPEHARWSTVDLDAQPASIAWGTKWRPKAFAQPDDEARATPDALAAATAIVDDALDEGVEIVFSLGGVHTVRTTDDRDRVELRWYWDAESLRWDVVMGDERALLALPDRRGLAYCDASRVLLARTQEAIDAVMEGRGRSPEPTCNCDDSEGMRVQLANARDLADRAIGEVEALNECHRINVETNAELRARVIDIEGELRMAGTRISPTVAPVIARALSTALGMHGLSSSERGLVRTVMAKLKVVK